MSETQVEKFVRDPESMKLFQQERLILEVTEQICELMDEKEITRSKLAEMLGTSKGYVSQLLDGSANMTLRTLSDVLLSLGRTASIEMKPLQSQEGLATKNACMSWDELLGQLGESISSEAVEFSNLDEAAIAKQYKMAA